MPEVEKVILWTNEFGSVRKVAIIEPGHGILVGLEHKPTVQDSWIPKSESMYFSAKEIGYLEKMVNGD